MIGFVFLSPFSISLTNPDISYLGSCNRIKSNPSSATTFATHSLWLKNLLQQQLPCYFHEYLLRLCVLQLLLPLRGLNDIASSILFYFLLQRGLVLVSWNLCCSLSRKLRVSQIWSLPNYFSMVSSVEKGYLKPDEVLFGANAIIILFKIFIHI